MHHRAMRGAVRMRGVEEPVYRGVLWLVGDRYTYRTMVFDGNPSTRRALRFCYADDGMKFVAGECTRETVSLDTPGTAWEVRGYVPRTASAIRAEEIDENGEVHPLDAWGDVSEFWPDQDSALRVCCVLRDSHVAQQLASTNVGINSEPNSEPT